MSWRRIAWSCASNLESSEINGRGLFHPPALRQRFPAVTYGLPAAWLAQAARVSMPTQPALWVAPMQGYGSWGGCTAPGRAWRGPHAAAGAAQCNRHGPAQVRSRVCGTNFKQTLFAVHPVARPYCLRSSNCNLARQASLLMLLLLWVRNCRGMGDPAPASRPRGAGPGPRTTIRLRSGVVSCMPSLEHVLNTCWPDCFSREMHVCNAAAQRAAEDDMQE